LKKAQIQWERRIQKSLNSMCNELNVPLARIRPNSDREELSEKWNELSTCDFGIYLFILIYQLYVYIYIYRFCIFFLAELSQYRPLYAPKDFLEVLFSVRDPSFKKQVYEFDACD
jgi:hypothetical protein